MVDHHFTSWSLRSPFNGRYVLTSQFVIGSVDFMIVDDYVLQGVGKRSKLRLLKHDTEAIYDPKNKIWVRFTLVHNCDTLYIVSDGNCFYFIGEGDWFKAQIDLTRIFIEDLGRYIIGDLDLIRQLRKQTEETVRISSSWI